MRTSFLAAALAVTAGCSGNGKEWVSQLPDDHSPVPDPGWNAGTMETASPDPARFDEPDGGSRHAPPPAPRYEEESNERVTISGSGATASLANDLFRNTYYDFPKEGKGGKKDATVFDAVCAPIAPVTKLFHDSVCVQGSGRLESGATISFAKRNCSCAATCPRTGQQICFERLDPGQFPAGRGATGKAITPLRTIAVDPNVIPLGTIVYIPELVGLPRTDGSAHNGCFIAEDRGLRVQGRQVDVFTGDPSVTVKWNKLFPSNRGVHVNVNDPRCR